MLKKLISMSIAVLLIAMTCIPVFAVSATYTLSIELKANDLQANDQLQGIGTLLSNGSAVSGAMVGVEIRNKVGNTAGEALKVYKYIVTDANGMFAINAETLPMPKLAVGNYVLIAEFGGTQITKDFTISAPVVVPGGGTPVVVPPTTPPQQPGTDTDTGKLNQEKTAEGDTKATLKVDNDKVKDDLQGTGSNLQLAVNGVQGANQVSFELGGSLVNQIADANKGVELKSDNATLVIPQNVIKQIGSKAGADTNVSFNISIVKNAPTVAETEKKPVSYTLDFSIQAGNTAVSNFDGYVTVSMKVDMTQVGDAKKVMAYYYNESTKQWEVVGGTLDSKTGILTFKVKHFSKYAAIEFNKTFADVKNEWSKSSIEVLASRYIMNGKGANAFDPSANITRAEFASILARALDLTTSTPTGMFKDVPKDAWYAAEVEAVAKAGIVQGSGDSCFKPGENITREQIAVMIMKAIEYKQGKITNVPQMSFTDASSIASYAKDAVAVASSKGIVKGTENKFNPKKNATREEAAVMVYRLMTVLGTI